MDITQSGRGGSITYREGANTIAFDWEFAALPAIALIFGPGERACRLLGMELDHGAAILTAT